MSQTVKPRRPRNPFVAPSLMRRAGAHALQAAGRELDRWAERLAATDAQPPVRPAPRVEFHPEPGAAGGALYLDGVRIGSLPGVMRL